MIQSYRTYRRVIPAFLLAGLLVGCAPSLEHVFTGTWKSNASITNPKGKAGGPGSTLDVREDKTFTLNIGVPIEGKWQVGNADMLALTATKIDGKDVATYMGKPHPSLPNFTEAVGLGIDEPRTSLTLSFGGGMQGGSTYIIFKK